MGVAGGSELLEHLGETGVRSGLASRTGGDSGTKSRVHDGSPVRLAVGRTIATLLAQRYQGIVEKAVLCVGQDLVLESSELSVESIWFTCGNGGRRRSPWVPVMTMTVSIPVPMAQITGVLLGLKTEIFSAQVAAALVKAALVTEHAPSRRRAV